MLLVVTAGFDGLEGRRKDPSRGTDELKFDGVGGDRMSIAMNWAAQINVTLASNITFHPMPC